MKTVKKLLKPIYAIPILLIIWLLAFVRWILLLSKSQAPLRRKMAQKISRTIQRLNSLIFDPYRISNGIYPRTALNERPPTPDYKTLHELSKARREAREEVTRLEEQTLKADGIKSTL